MTLLDDVFHSLWANAQKYFSPYVHCSMAFWHPHKWTRLRSHQSHSCIYFWIRSLRNSDAVPLSTLNVWNIILYSYLKCTGSQCSWGENWCYVFPFVSACHRMSSQTWGQFHIKFINSIFTYYFLPGVGTPSTYLEYLLWIVYIPSRIVMKEIFLV